jgi:hypothetical protein
MADAPAADRFTAARVRAQNALRARFWPSFRLSLIAFVGSLGVGGAVLQGLAVAQSLAPGTGWYIIGLFACAGPFTLLGLELHRLVERASALRELYDAQREYESLLQTARQERDEYRDKAIALAHQNEAVRSLAITVGIARAMQAREEAQR